MTKLLMKTVSENVADFLGEAVDRMNRERGDMRLFVCKPECKQRLIMAKLDTDN